ncbi:MAG: hypothetical protein R2792_12610 [Saprospiraceae bacterium]
MKYPADFLPDWELKSLSTSVAGRCSFYAFIPTIIEKGTGMLQITECLPDLKPGRHASELVLEWKPDV